MIPLFFYVGSFDLCERILQYANEHFMHRDWKSKPQTITRKMVPRDLSYMYHKNVKPMLDLLVKACKFCTKLTECGFNNFGGTWYSSKSKLSVLHDWFSPPPRDTANRTNGARYKRVNLVLASSSGDSTTLFTMWSKTEKAKRSTTCSLSVTASDQSAIWDSDPSTNASMECEEFTRVRFGMKHIVYFSELPAGRMGVNFHS